MITDFVEQRLIVGSASSEREESDDVAIEINFGTYESVDPVTVDSERVSEDFQRSGAGGASEKNDLATGFGL